ncbi:protein FAM161B [Aulostomus maculatus]
MLKLEDLLADGLNSELILRQQLRSLRETLMQQLQQTERRQREELEKRIHHNALISADVDQKHAGLRLATSTPALTLDKGTSSHRRQTGMPSAGVPSSGCNLYDNKTSRLPHTRAQHCESAASSKTTQQIREEEAVAECQRKFCALPVPSHVKLTLFQEMMELREKERKQVHEQRKNFLLSAQKPFSFQEREKEKKEKLVVTLNQVFKDEKNQMFRTSHKGPKKTDQEISGKVHIQTTRHKNPSSSGTPKLRTAERTKMEKLGFLDEKPSFQPKISHQSPDFSKLHKALQTEVLRKTQSKEVTKCQPFYLRTSALPTRKIRLSPENSQAPNRSTLSRSKSWGALTSLSTDTLPTYITDAVRKRCMAIRKSMEMRDSKNQESADWLKKYQMRSHAMKKTVSHHAKLLDPHSSLREVHNEKLQRRREADQQRTREYTRELRDMKARIQQRPYLFEQVKQKNAKRHAEQTYRDMLKRAGVREQFVEENGRAVEGTSSSSKSEDDTEENSHSAENGIHSCYPEEENVDDGEKIEDVEEKSVKSKGEEMP